MHITDNKHYLKIYDYLNKILSNVGILGIAVNSFWLNYT